MALTGVALPILLPSASRPLDTGPPSKRIFFCPAPTPSLLDAHLSPCMHHILSLSLSPL